MLFVRELKKVVFSVSYMLFVIIFVFSMFSQDTLNFGGKKISEPAAGENYGTKKEEIPEIVMPAALQSLYVEYLNNNYKTYPIGFVKYVKLDGKERMRIAEIIAAITGVDADLVSQGENESINPAVREDISYSEFQKLMQEVDDILGGGSDYAAESLIDFGTVPLTYEEAHFAYELMKSRDKITGGYARLFSDYAVAMVFSIFPVFLAVIMSMKDKHAKMSELIYTGKTSGMKIIFMRYLAILAAVMLPAIALSYISNSAVWGMYQGMELDWLAPLKYDFGWIMPSAMISAAVGMCLTELTNTPAAVAIQGLWWFVDLNMGMRSVSASYSLFRLAPRHNAGEGSYFRTQDYIDNFSKLSDNRLLFAGLSIFLVIVTVIIFNGKRKGKLNGNNKIKKLFAGIRNCRN